MGTDIKLPYSVRLTDPSERFQLRFAEAAAALLHRSGDLQFEATANGLIIWALWETRLEEAAYLVKTHFPNAEFGKPEVTYLREPEWQEPLLRMTIDTPEEHIGDVIGDLIRRRGLMVGMEESARGKLVTAIVPAAELFGYAVAFASMTRQRAAVTYEFAGYQPL